MANDDDESNRSDQQPLWITAGVAAAVLVVILVWAVLRTSDAAKTPEMIPAPEPSYPSSTHTTSTSRLSSTTTSYPLPSPQTSDLNPSAPPPPPPSSSEPPSAPGDEEETSATPTTTTTSSNAGAF